MSLLPLDFSTLTGEQFEDLVEAIFRGRLQPLSGTSALAQSSQFIVTSVSRSGRGNDAGLDLLVTTVVRDCISPRSIKWVVQCKHNAVSGRSVSPRDFINDFSFPELLAHHGANGYLLVCSTRPSTKLQARLDKLPRDSYTRAYVAWDYARVCEEVFSQEPVMKQFFPAVYERQQGLVERSRIDEWATQFNGSISQDARSALDSIVRLTLNVDEVKNS